MLFPFAFTWLKANIVIRHSHMPILRYNRVAVFVQWFLRMVPSEGMLTMA
jgi:hypothetical protein